MLPGCFARIFPTMCVKALFVSHVKPKAKLHLMSKFCGVSFEHVESDEVFQTSKIKFQLRVSGRYNL